VNQTEIRTIEVTLEFESTEPYFDKLTGAEKYASYYWREKNITDEFAAIINLLI